MRIKQIILISILYSSLMAQKNAISITSGVHSSLAYERNIFDGKEKPLKIDIAFHVSSTFLPSIIHLGKDWNTSEFKEDFYRIGSAANLQFGKRNNYLELGLGLDYHWNLRVGSLPDKLIFPNVRAGYKMEKEKWLIRAGFGFPEFIYLGIGKRY